jgi:hypothetical protein
MYIDIKRYQTIIYRRKGIIAVVGAKTSLNVRRDYVVSSKERFTQDRGEFSMVQTLI